MSILLATSLGAVLALEESKKPAIPARHGMTAVRSLWADLRKSAAPLRIPAGASKPNGQGRPTGIAAARRAARKRRAMRARAPK